MQFISERSGTKLNELLEQAKFSAKSLKIAVAYAHRWPAILEWAVKKKIPTEYYCRMDETIPVSVDILERIIDATNVNCYILQNLHAKIIWWKEFGVYIGSANLTEAAWSESNFEAGVFLTHNELQNDRTFLNKLETLFSEINEESTPLSHEKLDAIKEHSRMCEDSDMKKLENVKRKSFNDLNIFDEITPETRNKRSFIKEWNNTSELLRNMAETTFERFSDKKWEDKDVAITMYFNRFIHDYYENFRLSKDSIREQIRSKNIPSPELGFLSALTWWESHVGGSDPSEKGKNMSKVYFKEYPEYYQTFIEIKKTLSSKKSIEKMPLVQFRKLFENLYAYEMHTRRQGRTQDSSINDIYKTGASNNGTPVLEVLSHLLYGGTKDKIAERVFDLAYDDNWKIKNIGLSTIAEIPARAFPGEFMVRNNRTNKVLHALGYDVIMF